MLCIVRSAPCVICAEFSKTNLIGLDFTLVLCTIDLTNQVTVSVEKPTRTESAPQTRMRSQPCKTHEKIWCFLNQMPRWKKAVWYMTFSLLDLALLLKCSDTRGSRNRFQTLWPGTKVARDKKIAGMRRLI